MHVAIGPGIVLLGQRCDMLCTASFVDDIVFAHNGFTARHAYL